MDASSSNYGNNLLRQERILRNWRQQDVADQLGTTVVTVKRWERGIQQPSAYFRVRLCALFGKSAEELGLAPNNIIPPLMDESASDESLSDTETTPVETEHRDDEITSSPSLTNVLPADPAIELASSEKVLELKESEASQHLQRRRKALLLIGAGAAGLAAATVAALWPAFHNPPTDHSSPPKPAYPLQIPLSQRTHHLFDRGISNYINQLAWSPDGRYLATASATNVLVVWNVEQESIALTYRTLNRWVNDVSWSKTNWIAAVTAESSAGSLQLWQFPSSSDTPAITMKKNKALRSVRWSPDGTLLAISGHSPTVEVWRPFPYRLVSQYTDHTLGLLGISRVKWSPSGRLLACAADDGTAHVWDALTSQPIVIYHGHKSRVHDLAWSPDEKAIVSCGSDQTSQVWDVASGRTLMVYRGQKNIVEGIHWSPDGTLIASASADRTVHVWKPFTGQLVAFYSNLGSIVETVRWSNDGKWLGIGTDEGGADIWPGRY